MSKTQKTGAASIHQRLLNLAKAQDRPLNELLQHFAIERFLFRLGKTRYKDLFILKGAQMLRVWDAPTARPTMDIDLLGKVSNDIENLEQIIRECCLIEIDDGVMFDANSVRGESIKKDGEYQGVRIKAKGALGNIKLYLQIDVGFGDAVVPAPVEVALPQLLDLGNPILFGYTPESAVAEKFQSIVALDMFNTRMKDFYDIWLLSKTLEFDTKILAKAISETFRRRRTQLPEHVPGALTPEFTEDDTKQKYWQAFLRKNRLDAKLTLTEVAETISEFLIPLIR